MKNKSLLMTIAILIIAISSAAQKTSTFTDTRDGKTYKTVKIGTQTWMAENLAYKAESECWAYNNDTSNVKTYGYLYEWGVAKNVCPSGWHLPSSDDTSTLTGTLKNSGKDLFEAFTQDDPAGFNSLYGGWYLIFSKNFVGLGNEAGYWTTYQLMNGECLYLNVNSYKKTAGASITSRMFCYSVRCVQN
ncbi:MAG: hypothetical protein NTY07_17080 [Bacteroidia bacterium]|nr:hypothetical protein [Bacteroidia bacterium]